MVRLGWFHINELCHFCLTCNKSHTYEAYRFQSLAALKAQSFWICLERYSSRGSSHLVCRWYMLQISISHICPLSLTSFSWFKDFLKKRSIHMSNRIIIFGKWDYCNVYMSVRRSSLDLNLNLLISDQCLVSVVKSACQILPVFISNRSTILIVMCTCPLYRFPFFLTFTLHTFDYLWNSSNLLAVKYIKKKEDWSHQRGAEFSCFFLFIFCK